MAVTQHVESVPAPLVDRQNKWLRVFLIGACFVVVVAGLKVAAPILNLVLLGALVAQTLSPLPMWLMKRGFKPGSSVLISILVVIAGGLLLVVGFSLSTARLVDRLPEYQEGLVVMRDKLMASLADRGIDVAQIPLFQPLDPARAMSTARVFLGGLASALGSSILVILIAAVVVYELTLMRAHTDRQAVAGSLAARFDEVTADSRQYIALTGLVGLMQAGAILVVLLATGVDAPITWSVLFFFFQFIPGIGIPIALTAPALLALLEHGWQRAVIVVALCWFVNLIGDNVIKPKYYVTGLDLSLTTMVFAVIFWTWALGPAGTVLAVPLALTLKRVAAMA